MSDFYEEDEPIDTIKAILARPADYTTGKDDELLALRREVGGLRADRENLVVRNDRLARAVARLRVRADELTREAATHPCSELQQVILNRRINELTEEVARLKALI